MNKEYVLTPLQQINCFDKAVLLEKSQLFSKQWLNLISFREQLNRASFTKWLCHKLQTKEDKNTKCV